ncbi:JmjC domain-containing protein [Chloropicon roscoffensis]|uniref:JmjC domain-containing protein n=1 Tax=Chloropicon roscoffensis TaxID=1461544 RepID=A0AAX4PBM3_9CHLO
MFRPSTREGKEARRRVDSSYSSDKHRRGAFRWTLRRLLLFCLVGTLASLAWISRSGGALVAEELHVVAMLRIPAGSLTKKEFFDQYGNQTVIIEGGLRHHPATKLGLEGLREICAGSSIETFVYDPTSNLWGGHVDEKVMPFEEYIDKYVLNETNTERRYFPGGDPGIPILCPALELFAPIPNYVSIGMQELNHSGKGESSEGRFHPLVGYQPELFVGPGGTKTEMHMDNNPSPFWMSLYFGKKMFRTISYEDSVKHMPYYVAGESVRFSKPFTSRKRGSMRKSTLRSGILTWRPSQSLRK